MTQVAASILNSNLLSLGHELDRLAHHVDRIHFDVMDGHFVDNLSFGLPVLKQVAEHTHLPIDVHLMINNPEIYVERYAKHAASVYVHFEATGQHTLSVLQLITDAGAHAGLVLNPNTSVAEIEHLIPSLTHVLIMSVWPGFGGQQCIISMFDKISELKTHSPHLTVMVDGGITNITAPIALEKGADILVSGSYLMTAANLGEAVEELKR